MLPLADCSILKWDSPPAGSCWLSRPSSSPCLSRALTHTQLWLCVVIGRDEFFDFGFMLAVASFSRLLLDLSFATRQDNFATCYLSLLPPLGRDSNRCLGWLDPAS